MLLIRSIKFQSNSDGSKVYQFKIKLNSTMGSKLITDIFQPCFQKIHGVLATWVARQPGTALTLVIIASVIVLPLITSAALTPFVLLLDFSNFLAAKGIIFVIYVVFFQGILLVALVLVLFFIAFIFATALSLLYTRGFSQK